MALLSDHQHSSEMAFVFVLLLVLQGVSGATFTFVNKCDYTVWPGVLGKPDLETTGFELSKGSSRSFQAPPGWSGRFWARTNCKFDDSGHGTCATGDCGSGGVACNGAGASLPATLAEFTIDPAGSKDFYDVSLVDGYNLPMMVEANGGSGSCATTGCAADLIRRCPSELKADGGDACKSACDAFGKPEYCCKGDFGSPSTCRPSTYSEIFKSVCPKAYSYAYDDKTSTFTCAGADYTITFCPSSSPSLKSASIEADAQQSVEQAAAATSSWIANLATSHSTSLHPSISLLLLLLPLILVVSFSELFCSFQRLLSFLFSL